MRKISFVSFLFVYSNILREILGEIVFFYHNDKSKRLLQACVKYDKSTAKNE